MRPEVAGPPDGTLRLAASREQSVANVQKQGTNKPMKRRTLLLAALLPLAPVPTRAAQTIRLRELYNKDLSFSDLAKANEGQRISVQGYMAPPLEADTDFFVLTKRPMSVCPFCETEAEWPDDILAVRAKRNIRVVPYNVDILVRGVLELGTKVDESTGFLSRVRVTDAVVERL